MTYYGNINTDLLGWIPLTAGHVLELGCGEAALAAEYKRRNPQATYVAVEMEADAAAIAHTRVDRLLTGDFEAMEDVVVTGGRPFDAVVMGDVLEHLRDPVTVLARLHRLLADDGVLVLSVPNVAHWTVLHQLLNGRWPQQDQGLFDRTHLRWFTDHSLGEHLTAAGFTRVKMRPRRFVLDKAAAERWIPAMADMAASLGVDRAAFVERSQALQYVVVARKAERPQTVPLTLSVLAMAPRLLEVRAKLPAEALQSAPDMSVTYAEKSGALPALPADRPKVAVVQRAAPPTEEGWLRFLANAIRGGWVVATELDDHPALIARVHGRQEDAQSWLTVRAAHAVQTSTPALAQAIRTHQPEVQAFPNACFRLAPFRERGEGPVRIFYGALNRERFSVQAASALGPAPAAHPEAHVTVVHDRAFFEALPTPAKTFLPVQPYDDYLEAMAAADIALMPLEGAAEELFKSDVKYVEAASRGLAVIASPAVYADTIRDGETGLIAPTPADFGPALLRLLDDAALRRRLAHAAWEEVRDTRMFAQQVDARRAWYWSLWTRRRALTEALVARMPALGQMLAG